MHKRKIGFLKPGLLNLGTMDVSSVVRSCPVHIGQHPWPLPSRGQQHPPAPPTEDKNVSRYCQCLLGPKWYPVENHWLQQTIFFKGVKKEKKGGMWPQEERASSSRQGDLRCRTGHASVSTAPALSGRWSGWRGRSRSSPRAWTRGPGASCTSSPAVGWNRQMRSSAKVLNLCTFSKKNRLGP